MMTNVDINAESIHQLQRMQWTAAAPGWQRHRDAVSSSTSLITDLLIRLARIRKGDRVLDLACGIGDPAFAIAKQVGPDGYVLGLDITPAMLAGAQAYALQHGIQNVEFRLISSELEIAVPAASFDAATCRYGLMYMPDPIAALRALRDALKPGGCIAVSTWGSLEHCPFTAIPLQIVMRHLSDALPDAKLPNPFALATRGNLKRILKGAELTNVQTEAFDVIVYKADSPEELWEQACEVSVALAALLASLSEETRQGIREDAIKTFAGMFEKGFAALSGEALIAVGTKPD